MNSICMKSIRTLLELVVERTCYDEIAMKLRLRWRSTEMFPDLMVGLHHAQKDLHGTRVEVAAAAADNVRDRLLM